MDEEMIATMNIKDILSLTTLYSVNAEVLPEAREHLKALLLLRLEELKASATIKNQFKAMFKAVNQAQDEMAKEYTRQYAEEHKEIPIKISDDGKPLNTIDNFLIVLRNDEKFKSLKYNLLSFAPEKEADGKRKKWTDADDAMARSYIEEKYHLYSKEKLEDALKILFEERGYHPIKEIIESVKWDGIPRIETLFIKYLKCEDDEYTREVTRLVFAGGIHRLYNPGCKFDDVCVLVGTKQGEGKSSFIRWLAIEDEFFTEVTEIEGQKGIESIEGTWICEIAELLALTKAKDVEAVKSYITKLVDKYRRPFERRTTDVKRQCVFVGTTNKEQFLTDKTGNRRWYPLKANSDGYELHKRKIEAKADILQCWAEAKYLYDRGEIQPFARIDLLGIIREKQAMAVEDDYRVGMIEAYLEDKTKVCILELWQEALKNDFKPTRKDSNDIVLILQSLQNWKRKDVPERDATYGLQRFWVKIEDIDTEKMPF